MQHRLYVQDDVTKLVMENGKIKLRREYLNLIATARMLLPQGLASVPIRSVELSMAAP
ncbi:hypothetical protein [Dyella sp.]|uniref:hypothetical protein n=1 Tax=Dyella sp. TaxID=1869338 RepID=UPI002ED68398